jgi:hypothetical protein
LGNRGLKKRSFSTSPSASPEIAVKQMTRKKSPKKPGLPEDRNQAEQVLVGDPQLKETPNPVLTEAQRLLSELKVHQIELEMQNDELRKTELELSEVKTST